MWLKDNVSRLPFKLLQAPTSMSNPWSWQTAHERQITASGSIGSHFSLSKNFPGYGVMSFCRENGLGSACAGPPAEILAGGSALADRVGDAFRFDFVFHLRQRGRANSPQYGK